MTDKLKLVATRQEDYYGLVEENDYECDVLVTLAGDSIWNCTDTEVRITGISVAMGDEGYRHITVTHSGSWRVYTDSGFEQAVQELLDDDSISFTEQGMQDDGLASME